MNPKPDTFPTRYLTAKRTVDDRALNQHVWQTFIEALPANPHILEIGAGMGTMIDRLKRWSGVKTAHYTAIDTDPAHIRAAQMQIDHWLPELTVALETIDCFDFIAREKGKRQWDALIAHAFLDLVDIPHTLPLLFSLLPPGGLYYFTINFDGATILQPTIDETLDAQIEQLYHRTMDERVVPGKVSGGSRSGRRLFGWLQEAGTTILAAGSSDWVVYAGPQGYPGDEAYFLHTIINMMHQVLSKRPELDQPLFEAWITERHAQIDDGTLIYIAHQLDFCGRAVSS